MTYHRLGISVIYRYEFHNYIIKPDLLGYISVYWIRGGFSTVFLARDILIAYIQVAKNQCVTKQAILKLYKGVISLYEVASKDNVSQQRDGS